MPQLAIKLIPMYDSTQGISENKKNYFWSSRTRLEGFYCYYLRLQRAKGSPNLTYISDTDLGELKDNLFTHC